MASATTRTAVLGCRMPRQQADDVRRLAAKYHLTVSDTIKLLISQAQDPGGGVNFTERLSTDPAWTFSLPGLEESVDPDGRLVP